METKTILVTGIGGNVGQGIIRNILNSNYPVRIIGTNVTDFSAGNHMVDSFYRVPFGYDDNFIPTIISIVKNENVSLIIPSTDFESYYLALNRKLIPCLLAGSDSEASEQYIDKYLTSINHKLNDIPFAETLLPSEYKNDFQFAIAKPRKGRGSKGLIFNSNEFSTLTDDTYIIQKFHTGLEITSAIYRRYNDDEIHGLISMERSLENGATTYCKVNSQFDDQVKDIASKMCIANSGLKGSFNIQSIVNSEGQVIPFEINCRISGTNSIRSGFGFNDVRYTIEELLWNITPEKPQIIEGFAFRYLTDVIYNGKAIGNNKDSYKIF